MRLVEISYLFQASSVTLVLALIAIFLSTIFGLVAGLTMATAGRTLRIAVMVIVHIVRGVPILVQLFLVYFGIQYFGLRTSPYVIAIIAISTYMGVLVAETVRGAITAVSRQQVDSGLALGMTPLRLMWEVILPQALMIGLPPYVNLIPVTIKATSLASVISIWELTLASKEIASTTLATFTVFGAAFGLYFALCYPFTVLGRMLEKRFATYVH